MSHVEKRTEITVKEKDIDELQHVNNGVYVNYLEQGRLDWYAEAGLPIPELQRRGMGTVVLKLEITFKKEAVLGDDLVVVTAPSRMGRTSFVFTQTIFNQSGELITEAIVTSVMFDRAKRKSIPVLEEITRRF